VVDLVLGQRVPGLGDGKLVEDAELHGGGNGSTGASRQWSVFSSQLRTNRRSIGESAGAFRI
jgi:hypothetical protein